MANSPDTMSRHSLLRTQFGIGAMLWSTLVIAMALGYLRQFSSPTLYTSAAIVIATAVVVGGLIGWFAGRIPDAIYWSVVISIAAFLSVAGDVTASSIFRYAWSAVGIMAGAVCGAMAPRHLIRRMFGGAVAGGAAMLACSVAMPIHDLEWIFDLICAPVVGGLVAVLIELVLWLEHQRYSPRSITASWLLCAVIVGNLLVPFVLT